MEVKKTSRIPVKEKLQKYHEIYEQIYENPYIRHHGIAENTEIRRSTVSRYLLRMHKLSIMQGPTICVKPAENYHEYARFLLFDTPRLAYNWFKGFPCVISRSLNCGSWDLLLICEKLLDFSVLKGFKKYIYQGVKSVTYIPRVTSLDWDHSIESMYNALSQSKKKSVLYEEVPGIPWDTKGWTLYHRFKSNVRVKSVSVLKECGIPFGYYQEWVSSLPEVTCIKPGFFPLGVHNYLVSDFLFESVYHKQVADILGMLPSTSIFFSVGDYLFMRLSMTNKKEKDDLLSFVFHLGEEGFFSSFYYAAMVFPYRGKS